MPIANLTAILQALPLTVTLGAALFLREPVGWKRLAAIGVGFLGVLLVVRPQAGAFDIHALYALVCVAFVTLRELLTRRVSREVPSLLIAWANGTAVMLFGLAGAMGESFVAPDLVTGPLLLAFGVTYTTSWPPLLRIRELLVEMLGRPMAQCRWYDLLLLAALAGVCEELLFRGVIQPLMAGDDAARPLAIGFVVALIGSNLLFGLLHPITPTYAIVVGLVGTYLGLVGLVDPLPAGTPSPGQLNLVVPMVAHGLYDFLAFLVIAGESRRRDTARADVTGIVESD